MEQSHKRNKTVDQMATKLSFTLEEYLSSPDPSQLLTDTLKRKSMACHINLQKMSMNQMQDVIECLPIKLKIKQVHELFLYATYEHNMGSKANQKRTKAISTSAPNKINIPAFVRWIQIKISKSRLQIGQAKTGRSFVKSSMQQGYSQITERTNILPKIKTRPEDRFKAEIANVLNIFSQMEKERQNAGLQPVCLQDEEQIHDVPNKQVFYDGDFFQVNEKLNRLRSQAQQKIEQIISASKQDKNLQRKFEDALMRYQKVRNEANDKIGRCGAMKAHKRMIDKRTEQIRNIDKWRVNTGNTEVVSKYY